MGGVCSRSSAVVPHKPSLAAQQQNTSLLRSSSVREELLSEGKYGAASESALHSKYELSSHILGRGSFGVVKTCRLRETGELRACKIISKQTISKQQEVESEYLNAEIDILRRAGSHPSILQVFDVYETAACVYVILELATGGSLVEVVQRSQRFSERDAASAMHQIATALAYLHSLGIVHRDLKPANVLVANHSSFEIKVTDFGLSKSFDDRARSPSFKKGGGSPCGCEHGGCERQHDAGVGVGEKAGRRRGSDVKLVMHSACGSAAYAAPELFSLLEEEEEEENAAASGHTGGPGAVDIWSLLEESSSPPAQGYDQSVDIWGLGIITCILLTGVHPLQSVKHREVKSSELKPRTRKTLTGP